MIKLKEWSLLDLNSDNPRNRSFIHPTSLFAEPASDLVAKKSKRTIL